MRFIALLCAFTVVFSSVAFAASATPSNAVPASYSNAQIRDAQVGSDVLNPLYFNDDVVLMSDGDDSGYGVDWVYTGVWQSSSGTKYLEAELGSDGFYHFNSPGAGYRLTQFRFYIYSSRLPSTGTYGFNVSISQGNVDADLGSASLQFDISKHNVSSAYPFVNVSSFSNTGTAYTLSSNVTLPSGLEALALRFNLKNPTIAFDLGLPSWQFLLYSVSGDDVSTDVGQVSDSDNLGSIASNTGQIVSGQSAIMDTIKEQIQYITMQIEAFWNQLAGEFTNLFDKLNQQIANDNQNTQDIISNLDQNASDITSNIDKNTDTITSGWDDSKLEQSGNQLNDSLTQYDDVESGIHDTASGWLDDYTLPDFDQLIAVPGILSALTWLGTFMQTCFTNMGAFNIPVTLSLVLIFVLILVGYYRIRR